MAYETNGTLNFSDSPTNDEIEISDWSAVDLTNLEQIDSDTIRLAVIGDLSFDATAFDDAASQDRVVHESTADTDHDDASRLKVGSPVSPTHVSSNLELYLPLQEDTGSANDFSGNNNDGTINGSVTQGTAGPFGTTAYDFGGGYLEVPDASPINITGDLTVSFWIRVDTVGVGHTQGIVSKAGSDASSGYSLKIDDPTSGDPLKVRIDGTGYAFANSVPTGTWVHYAWVQSGSTSTLYKNGTQVDSISSATLESTNSDSLWLGANRWNASDTLSGALWDVRVYSTNLSDAQIETLALSSPPTIKTLSDIEQTDKFGQPDENVSNTIVDSSNFGWTSGGVYEYGNVVYESGATDPFKFWVTGVDGSGGTIGLLTSSDGYSWSSDDANNPLGVGSGYEDPYVVPPADHNVDESTYFLFAERNSDSTTVRFEGTDPYAINNNETVIVSPGASGSWDDDNAASPTPFKYDGTAYCIYEGLPSSGDDKIGIATASAMDAAGEWTKSDDNPIIDGNNFDGSYGNSTLVPDEIFRRSSDGRWFLTLHTVDDDAVRHRAILYTDTDPANWASTSDWTEFDANPIQWDRHGDTSDHNHTAMEWQHPDDDEFHIMINQHKSDTIYQDRFYEAGDIGGSLITGGKTL